MSENSNLHQKCQSLFNEPGIRFVGIVNNMGRQVAGGYKEGITPLVDDKGLKMCMEYTLQMFMTKDLDAQLGCTEYIIAKRNKVKIISIPIKNNMILISTESDADDKHTIQKALNVFAEDLPNQNNNECAPE